MRLCHTTPVGAASFDEPNLVSAAGVVPVMRPAADAGLGELAGELLTVPTDNGVNAGRLGAGRSPSGSRTAWLSVPPRLGW